MTFESSEYDESQRVKFVSQLFKGEGLSWWNLTRSALWSGGLAKLTWVTFKKKVMNKYCNKRALDKIEEELKNLKNGIQSIAEYSRLSIEKLSLVEHLATDDEDKGLSQGVTNRDEDSCEKR